MAAAFQRLCFARGKPNQCLSISKDGHALFFSFPLSAKYLCAVIHRLIVKKREVVLFSGECRLETASGSWQLIDSHDFLCLKTLYDVQRVHFSASRHVLKVADGNRGQT